MSERLLRTFISVPLPNEVKKLQKDLKTLVNDHGAKVKWVESNNLHLTLKFIGHTPEDDVNKIGAVLNNIISNTREVNLRIEGTGCFPKPERPRVLWLGVTGMITPLRELVSELNEALDPLGYPKEEKEYTPHLTLARIKYPQKYTPDVNLFLQTSFDSIPFSISKIHFMRSELFSKGSVYTILDTHFLS